MGRYFGVLPSRLMLIAESELTVSMAINTAATLLLSDRDRIERESQIVALTEMMMLGGVGAMAQGLSGATSAHREPSHSNIKLGGLPVGTSEVW